MADFCNKVVLLKPTAQPRVLYKQFAGMVRGEIVFTPLKIYLRAESVLLL